MSSPSLKPQSTGSNLGSRNPFLELVTPQSTGAVNASGISMPEPRASTSAAAAALNQNVDPPTVPPKDSRASSSSPPLPDRKSLERRPTGALNSGDRDVDELTTSLSASRPFSPPALPPRAPETTVTSPGNHTAPARNSTLDFLQEDLPPAYTPGPDARQGEQSIDFGPVRPFQNEQIRPPRQPAVSQQPYFTPPPGGGSLARGSGGSGSLGRALGGLLLEILSERDRGSTLTSNRRGAPGLLGRSFISEPYGQSMPSQSSAPSMPSQAPRGWSAYPGQPGRSRTPEPRERPADDGKPTARPVPGHPLLRDNKVLIYPLGHECRKCFNKGFRPLHASTFDSLPRALAPGDPSDPCKKCWHRYAQPYTSILSQLDWKTSVETNFQRPISDPDVVSPPSVTNPSRARTIARPRSMTPPPPSSSVRPQQQQQQFTGGVPGGWIETGRSSYNGIMSPGSGVIYEPGDPRIGGRLCVRCHGAGRIRVFILETELCTSCGGVGRVF